MNPKYAAQVGYKWSGSILKTEFTSQQGLRASKKINSQHWESITVDKFKIIVLRDSTAIINCTNSGNIFGEPLKIELQKLQTNDIVLIFDIYVKEYDGTKVLVQPVEYIIE